MKIVFLGWGSLIWNSNGLSIKGDWQRGGPALPIEFSRISKDRRLTLVIDEVNGVDVITRYALSSRTDVKEAVEDLRIRECTSQDFIGFLDLTERTTDSTRSLITKQIRDWAMEAGIDAVIWTALTPNFEQKTGKQFSVDRAVTYLQGLSGADRENAFDYIRKAPEEVNTPLRKRFQRSTQNCTLNKANSRLTLGK
jgi:hypothetical protein